MSRHEFREQHNRVYSNWHRYACADSSKMIDIDGLDYCRRCRMPLLLVEAARESGKVKSTLVIEQLARAANVPAICVRWTPADDCPEQPPHCRCQATKILDPTCEHGIAVVRVRRVHPNPTDFIVWKPRELAEWIDWIHANHEAAVCSAIGWGAA